ncbi:hypothetical protein FJ251_13580 [bacterium]|nr:hypothetical protein [bacterium]
MRRTVRIALVAALAAALGFLFAPLPNVELFSFSLFVGGSLLGLTGGGAAALLAVTLYYGLNPYGSSLALPLLFAAQLLAGLAIATLGALYARLLPVGRGAPWLRRLALLPFALLAALALPVLPSLAYLLVAGGAWEGWAALGVLMTAGSLAVNLIVFGTSYDPLLRQAARLECAAGGAHA